MEYKQLGNTSLDISRIGFGCMSLPPAEAQAQALLQQAVALGINFFDTADLYDRGRNEEVVGKALRHHRETVLIATKVGNRWKEDGSGWEWSANKAYILKACEDSLRRLRTDHIDLYQLHGGMIEDPVEDVVEAFETLKTQGKIRYYGISSIRPDAIRAYTAAGTVSSVMMQYSILDRRPEESAFELVQQAGAGLLARGSLAKGLLVNKPADEYLGYSIAEVAHAALNVRSISGLERSAAQTAIGFVLGNPAITAAVVGIRTREQLEEVARTVDEPALTALELDFLKQSLHARFYESHR